MNESTKLCRTKEELISALNEQLIFLKHACEKYDEGELFYAKQISNHLRILLYDSRSCHSLYKQLGKSFLFRDSRDYGIKSYHHNSNPALSCQMVKYIVKATSDKTVYFTVKPKQMTTNRFMPFDLWWDSDVIYWKENVITRSKIIRLVADEDGGAHIDPKIHRELLLFKRNIAQTAKFTFKFIDENNKPFKETVQVSSEDLLFATIRTIAAETLEAFTTNLSTIIK